jgi:purine-nucleoside phosphorylase
MTASATSEKLMTEFDRAEQAAQFILSKTSLRPQIALVLGSGLGAFADSLESAIRIAYADIPHYPKPTAEGHAGQLVIGKVGEVVVAAMQGRVHLYEGQAIRDVVFPMRVFGRMGVGAAILTNAAGGINHKYKAGCLVVLNDHLNLSGCNPLTGANDPRFGVRFPDMTNAYDPAYQDMAFHEAHKLGLEVFHGVYAALPGPTYETPAEIRFLRTIGADLVGMSTVNEVIVARHMGMKVLAISCVTNMAAGIVDQPITHAEVLETGARVRASFEALLRAVIPQIAEDLKSKNKGS